MVPITQLGYHWKAIMSFFFLVAHVLQVASKSR